MRGQVEASARSPALCPRSGTARRFKSTAVALVSSCPAPAFPLWPPSSTGPPSAVAPRVSYIDCTRESFLPNFMATTTTTAAAAAHASAAASLRRVDQTESRRRVVMEHAHDGARIDLQH